MRLPRLLHRLRAWLGGYFWMPCPLCGRKFGGHEWRDIDAKPSSIPLREPDVVTRRQNGEACMTVWSWTSVGICPACTAAGYGWDHLSRPDDRSTP